MKKLDAYYDGVPRFSDYLSSLSGPLFMELSEYSTQWLAQHEKILRPYANKWVKDPLMQWSRKWEYPYIANHLCRLRGSSNVRVLDAGSGVTFLPFWYAATNPRATVCAVDSDPEFTSLYEAINSGSPNRVHFTPGDLAALPFDDASLNVIYCISVLEHTVNPEAIIEEFRRVLAEQGLLFLTIDLSIDGLNDISLERASGLLELVECHFSGAGHTGIPGTAELDDSLTTWKVAASRAAELPWGRPSMRARVANLLRRRRVESGSPPLLTIYCGAWTKNPADGPSL